MRPRTFLAAIAFTVADLPAEGPASSTPAVATAVVRFSEPSLRFTYTDVEAASWSDVRALLDDPAWRDRMGSTTCSLRTSCVHSSPPEVTLSMDLVVVTPGPSSTGPEGWLPYLAGVLRHELLHVGVFLDMWQEFVTSAGRLEDCAGLDPLQDVFWSRAQGRNADLDREERVPLPQDEAAPPSPRGTR